MVDLAYGQTAVAQSQIKTCGPSVGTGVPTNYPVAPFLAGLLNSHHGGVAGQAPQIKMTELASVSSANAGGGIATVYAYAGNPNGFVAGVAAVPGVSPPDLCINTLNGQIYACTSTGPASGTGAAVWTPAGSGGSVTSVGIADAANGGIAVTGSPVTGAGTITLNLSPGTLLTKATPTTSDGVLIMDNAASGAAKTATIAEILGAGAVTNVADATNGGLSFSTSAGVVTASLAPNNLVNKASPVVGDLVLIGDSAASDAPKATTLSAIAALLGGGTGTVTTGAVNDLAYYASAGNAVSGLATANNGVLVTSASGVPSIGTTLPAQVQSNITSLGTVTSGTWSAGAIAVAHGGTGQTSFTANSLLLANSASSTASLGAATNGQIPIGSTGLAPALSTLAGSSGVSVTNGAGSVTLGLSPGSLAAKASPVSADLVVIGDSAAGDAAKTTTISNLASTILASAPFSAKFTSSAQAMPAAGSTLTVAHGLGAVPFGYQVYLQCVTAENGWSVGDTVQIAQGTNGVSGTSNSLDQIFYADATNIHVLLSANAGSQYVWMNKSTGATVGLTIANWNILIKAWL
jgi:hypothetical protein